VALLRQQDADPPAPGRFHGNGRTDHPGEPIDPMPFHFSIPLRLPTLLLLTAVLAAPAAGDDEGRAVKESPWLLTPTLSSNPKLGITAGGVAGYLHRFDAESNQSVFAVFGTYSDTDSYIVGFKGEAYFGRNRHKLTAGYFTGEINNEYDDFLGTGLPAQTEDDLQAIFLRYVHRLGKRWYFGGQFASTNYAIGADGFFGAILDQIGLTGFDSTALGLVAEYDTRDDLRNPSQGSHSVVHNLAYREALGGDESFDSYHADSRIYRGIGDHLVLAAQLLGRWTDDAPLAGYSSVSLRGYTRGNYLAENYTHLDLDARFALNERWGVAAFAGIGCLYDELSVCSGSGSTYPAAGAGVIFRLKPEAGFVLRAEYALGKDDNSALYLRLGHPF
jgi:outer membrane protein assembly factor BamA